MNLRMLSTTLALALALGACTPTTNIRGYLADQRLVDSIQPGVDNQESIRAMLGTPTVEGAFGRHKWYYVSKTSEQLAFFHPETIDQRVITVSFDDRGYVNGIDKVGLEAARDINPVGGKTPSRGRELGFWEQIFGNIGRFSGGGAPAGPEQ